jgi:DNA repair exonuclease SbcCD nuclease subunit
MGLKILHSADWHLDSPFASFGAEQRELLQDVQRRIPGLIADACRRECCDLVLLAGDIFDGNPSRDTVDRVRDALARCAVPVFVAPGNHDFCRPGSPWLEESWPENVFVFTGGLKSVALPELDCRVYGAGYQSMDCPPLLEGFRAEGQERYCIALLHGDPVSSQSPCCPVTAAQVRDSGLDYLALGHIHKAGAFRSGATLCAWPGSPMGRGWDETGEKGICVVTLGDGAELQAVPLDTICFREEQLDIGKDAAAALEGILPGVGSRDFYRITLTGQGCVDAEGLRKQFSRFPNLELRDETEPPVDLWADIGEDSLRGVYFRLLRDAPEGEETVRLAAEISHRLLAGREVRLP